jgi:hypothetical protein
MTEAPFTHIVVRRISSGTESFVSVGTLLKESEIPHANLVALVGADYVVPLTDEEYAKHDAPAEVETVKADEVVKSVATKPTAAKSPAKKPATKTVKKANTK